MTTVPHPAATTSRRSDIALWVLQVLLAAFYAMGALPKILGDPATLQSFALIGFGPTGTLVIGVLEVAGAIGLLVPRLCGLAALAFAGLMTGAVLLSAIGIGVAAALLPAGLLVV